MRNTSWTTSSASAGLRVIIRPDDQARPAWRVISASSASIAGRHCRGASVIDLAHGQSLHPRPSSPWTRVRRWCGRAQPLEIRGVRRTVNATNRGGSPMKRYADFGLVVLLAAGASAHRHLPPELLWVQRPVRRRPEGVASVSAAAPIHTGPLATAWPARTAGTAETIHRLADGRRVLRFTDFHTSNGPDARVYLVAASDAADSATVTRAGFSRDRPSRRPELRAAGLGQSRSGARPRYLVQAVQREASPPRPWRRRRAPASTRKGAP